MRFLKQVNEPKTDGHVQYVEKRETHSCKECGAPYLDGYPHDPSYCIDALKSARLTDWAYIEQLEDFIDAFVSIAEPQAALVHQARERRRLTPRR